MRSTQSGEPEAGKGRAPPVRLSTGRAAERPGLNMSFICPILHIWAMIILVSLVFLGRTSLKLTQAIIALLSVLVVCACTVGGERGRDSQATQYTPLEGLSSQERLKAVLFLLQEGEPLPAREELLV